MSFVCNRPEYIVPEQTQAVPIGIRPVVLLDRFR